MCIKHGDIPGSEVFPNNTDPVGIDFYKVKPQINSKLV